LPDQGVEAAPDAEGAIARGKYILRAAGCVTCHTAEAEEALPLAGGRQLATPFGTFHAPNIPPHRSLGIGRWSETDFRRALSHGLSPAGDPYYPAFPYTSYTGMTGRDMRDLFSYIRSLPAVANAVPGHDLAFPFNIRMALWPWRWLYFEPATFEPDPDRSDAWNRGAYLVNHLGHCGECHTPRNALGAKDDTRPLAGKPEGPEGKAVPNITPHPDDGIGGWDSADITFFLQTGFLPDGDVAGGGMGSVIEDSTSHLTDDDRTAIATYLMSLDPVGNE
jgi:mono/diheme cytochrome c family protein